MNRTLPSPSTIARFTLFLVLFQLFSQCFLLPGPSHGISILWFLGLGGTPHTTAFTPGNPIDIDGNGTNDGTVIDQNGDGKGDGIDVNGDGSSDIGLIDTNGDGIPDGIDTNGDGQIDYPIVVGPGGTIAITDPVTGNPVTLVDSNGDGISDSVNVGGTPPTTAPITTISGAVGTPTFTPTAGTYSSDQNVAITTATAGATTIYYTVDGTTPTLSSAVYSAPIAVAGHGTSTTIKAMAIKSGMIDSPVASGNFTIHYSQVSTPQFSPASGTYTSDQNVSITSGTTIYYTTDGTPPATSVGGSTLQYTGPIAVAGNGASFTIKAIAVKSGMLNSTVASSGYTIIYPPVGTPTFSPTAGTYNTDQNVSLATITSGAAIFYTTDGSNPATSVGGSTLQYNTPISIAGNGTNLTIKAIATKAGMSNSNIASAAYTINWDTAAMPTFSPVAGTYTSAQNVTLSSATAGASIYYTTDGTTPANTAGGSTSLYSSAINVAVTTTIKAISVKSGMLDSTVASGTFTIPTVKADAPTFTPVTGSYATSQIVSISTTTAGASIYYTTDGSTPTTSSNLYLSPFVLGSAKTIKAIAVKSDALLDSNVAVAEYKILQVTQVSFSLLPGNYASAQNVNLYSGTPGATIYYTADGSAPTTSSTQYMGTVISIAADTTIKAMAVKSGYTNSPVSSASYTIAGAAKYAVGGWVSGLYGGTLVIQNNGGDNVTLTGNGPFVFPTPLASGTNITVTVLTQPSPQTCRVDMDDTGTASKTIAMTAANFLKVSVVCGPVSLPVADTGQTLCYNDSTSIACGNASFPRQDGDFVNIPLARSFTGPSQHGTYTSDYTTTDNVTGLVWKTCSEGKSGATCATGTASTATWINAGLACRNLNDANAGAGYSGRKDWRLPTMEELESLPNYGASSPSIDTASFPGMIIYHYWSSNSYTVASANAWHFHFGDGVVNHTNKPNTYNIHCVSGGNGSVPVLIDNGDQTVTDTKTGLVWQKCSMGQNNDGTCSGTATTATWTNALAYCNGLSLAGKNWRLPNVNELKSIRDKTKLSPSIDTASFPGTISNWYWSSSSSAATSTYAWDLHFNDGFVRLTGNKASYTEYVRCVTH